MAKNVSLMKDLFENYVEKVEIVPWGVCTEDLNSNIPGICKVIDNNKYAIHMWGYTNAPQNKYKCEINEKMIAYNNR